MTHYKYASGKPAWKPRRGTTAAREANAIDQLVKAGMASRWLPLQNVEDAIKLAGL